MSTWLVAYVKDKGGKKVSDYIIFCDSTPYTKAKKFYKKLIKEEDTYTANMCKVKKTTEHYELK